MPATSSWTSVTTSPAVSFERVLSGIRAKFVVGLTATAKRRDSHQPILHMQIRPVRFEPGRKAAESADSLTKTLVVRETSFTSSAQSTDPCDSRASTVR